MKHILGVLTVAATLALSATAAFAAGDGVDYPGAGRPTSTIIPSEPSVGSPSFVAAGLIDSRPFWTILHVENWGR